MICKHAIEKNAYFVCINDKVKADNVTLNYCLKCSYNTAPKTMRFGDVVESAVSLIPGIKKLPCYDVNGILKPESGCGKRKERLNRLFKK